MNNTDTNPNTQASGDTPRSLFAGVTGYTPLDVSAASHRELERGAGAELPRRVQRSRAKGSKLPPNTVCVTRGTKWGNPFKVNTGIRGEPMTLGESLNLFKCYCDNRMAREPKWLEPLRGKNLACFCGLSQRCHADILLRLAGEGESDVNGSAEKGYNAKLTDAP